VVLKPVETNFGHHTEKPLENFKIIDKTNTGKKTTEIKPMLGFRSTKSVDSA